MFFHNRARNGSHSSRRPGPCRPRLEVLEGRTLPSANLFANGSFEKGNAGFSSDYIYRPGNVLDTGYYDVTTDPHLSNQNYVSYGDHTTGAGRMMVINGATVPDQVVWAETVVVSPGTPHIFSIWVSSAYPSSPARLDFLFNDVLIGSFTAPGAAGVWQEFRTGWFSGDNCTVSVRIIDRNTDVSGNDFALDDISLTQTGGPSLPAAPFPGGVVPGAANGTPDGWLPDPGATALSLADWPVVPLPEALANNSALTSGAAPSLPDRFPATVHAPSPAPAGEATGLDPGVVAGWEELQ